MNFKKNKSTLYNFDNFDVLKGWMILSIYLVFLGGVSSTYLDAAGVKSFGMGNAGVAYPVDAVAGALNPAGMAFVGSRFDIGVGDFIQSGNTKVYGNAIPAFNTNYDATKTRHWPFVEFGLCYQLNPCISIGIVAYGKALPVKTTYRVPFPLFGTSKLNSELNQAHISPMLAIKINNSHSLGIAFNIGIQRAKVGGFQNFDTVQGTVDPGHVTNRGYSWSEGFGFSLGWLSRFLEDQLSIGIRYDSETHMSRFRKYTGFLAQKGKLNLPASIALGIAYKICPNLTLLADAEYVWLSKIKSVGNSVFLPNGSVAKLGANNGPGHGYRNTWVYHFGAEYAFACESGVRLGWIHNNHVPFKPNQNLGNPHTLALVKDILTLGGTWRFYSDMEISIAYLHGFYHKQKGHNSIIPPLGGGEIDLSQRLDIFELGFGILF